MRQKSHATAWAAVKTKYEQDDKGNWKVKESLSSDNKRQLLNAALQAKFSMQAGQKFSPPWVEDFTDTEVIYSLDGQQYRAPYTTGEDGQIVFGDGVKVVRQTVYAQAEALHRQFADIIRLAAERRNGSTIKEIEEAHNLIESLDWEKSTKASIMEATKRLQEIMTLVKALEAVKTEDGTEYSAAAFAYVPDPEKPSTWKLRLWEDPTKKVTRKQLGAAAAALSPGGFRGQKADIPSEDLPAVKRKIRAAYRSLDVPEDDMPKWVRESEARTLITEFIPLTEATVTAKGRGQVRIIKPGFNESKTRYYPRELLARDYKVFEGNKMFADHPTEAEERARPEGSIRNWVATLENVRVRDTDGALVGDYTVIEPWMEAKLAKLRDAGQLDKIGVSINAVGSASRQKIDGVETNFVERLVVSRSVDFVTEPGAGGRVEIFEANDPTLDVDLVDIARLKERRPDLVKVIEDDARSILIKEAKRMSEQDEKIKELEGQKVALTQENENLKGKLTETDKAKAKAEAQARIKEAVGKAELPDAARARLLESFKDAESDKGIASAIKGEQDYIAALAEAGKVKGMGPSGSEADPAKAHKELVESFKRTGMSDKEAEIAASAR